MHRGLVLCCVWASQAAAAFKLELWGSRNLVPESQAVLMAHWQPAGSRRYVNCCLALILTFSSCSGSNVLDRGAMRTWGP